MKKCKLYKKKERRREEKKGREKRKRLQRYWTVYKELLSRLKKKEKKPPVSVVLKILAMHRQAEFKGDLASLWTNPGLHDMLLQTPGLHTIITEDQQTILLSSWLTAHLPHIKGGELGS